MHVFVYHVCMYQILSNLIAFMQHIFLLCLMFQQRSGKQQTPMSALRRRGYGWAWCWWEGASPTFLPPGDTGRVLTLGLQSDGGGNPDWSLILEQVLGSGWVGAVSGGSLNVMLFTDSNRPFLRTPRRLNVLELFASQPSGCTGNIGYQL